MTWELIIPGIAAGLSLLAIFLELLTHDREKGKEMEFSIARKQREIKKFQKEKNTKAMMAANKELMSLMSKNFRLRMKTMLISFPLFIVIFWLLNGMLAVAPLTAGSVSQIGFDLKNLDKDSQQNVRIELVSADIQVSGTNARSLELDHNGDNGDRQQVWWNITAPEGDKAYTLRVTANNKTENKTYPIAFVPAGSMSAGFSSPGPSELLDKSLGVAPVYKSVEINLAGMQLSWYIYYIITYFIMAAVLSPVKNKLLWGHHKGVKHLEKLDREQSEGPGEMTSALTKESR